MVASQFVFVRVEARNPVSGFCLCTSLRSWTIKAIGSNSPQQPPARGRLDFDKTSLSLCSCLHFLPAPFGLAFEIKLRPPERKAVEPFVADSLWFVSSPSCAVNIFTRKETKIYNACINLLAIWFIVGVANGFEPFELLQQRKRAVSACWRGWSHPDHAFSLTSLQVLRRQAAGSSNRVMYKRSTCFLECLLNILFENEKEDWTRHDADRPSQSIVKFCPLSRVS